jgi:hypothetical protein
MNTSNSPPSQAWEDALARLLDAEPEPGDSEWLAEAMRRDPALRREMTGLLAIDDLLRQNAELSPEHFVQAFKVRIADAKDDDFVRQVRDALPQRQPAKGQRRWWMAAAAAMLMGLIAVIAVRFARTPQIEVATLLLAEGCEWTQHAPPQEGARLASGPMRLQKGLAVVRFDGGAELILRGNTELELQSAARARLTHGDITVRADDEAAGFTLMTPTSEMIDLGTEFAAKVERSGATELHVLEGEVAVSSTKTREQRSEVIHAGKAIRFENAQSATHREVELRADRFEEIVRAARPAPRSELMLAYEGFFYAPGRHGPAEVNGGLGWRGPWRSATKLEAYRDAEDVTREFSVIQGAPHIPWPMPEGKPGMLEMPAGTRSIARTLERPIALDKDGVTYFSFMVRDPDLAPGLTPREFGGVRLVFRSSANPTGEIVGFGPSRVRRPSIRLGEGHNFTSPMEVARNQNTLWIGKIISRRNGDDDFFFSVYGERDTFGFAEPATWQVASRGIKRDGRLDLVVIATQLSAPCAVDELRIGPTWRSIAPMQELTQAP